MAEALAAFMANARRDGQRPDSLRRFPILAVYIPRPARAASLRSAAWAAACLIAPLPSQTAIRTP